MTAEHFLERIEPEVLLPETRARFPSLQQLIDKVETVVPGMRAVAGRCNHDYVMTHVTSQRAQPTLLFRLALFSVAVTNRGIHLSEAIAREVEADSLFGSAAVARAQLDLIGLSAYAWQKVEPMTDPQELADVTKRLSFAARSIPDSPGHFPSAALINAAKEQLGEHFGDDYGFLCDLTHPNAVIMWEGYRHLDNDELRPNVNEDRALVKVAGQGLRAIGHNAKLLVDHAVASNVQLPVTSEPQ